MTARLSFFDDSDVKNTKGRPNKCARETQRGKSIQIEEV